MWEDEAFVQLDFDLEDGPDDSHGKPPNVSEDELRQLDENAAKREVTRQKEMGVVKEISKSLGPPGAM